MPHKPASRKEKRHRKEITKNIEQNVLSEHMEKEKERSELRDMKKLYNEIHKETKCVICYEDDRCMVMYPCAHRVLCQNCAWQLSQKNGK